jgi:hypothetical protein
MLFFTFSRLVFGLVLPRNLREKVRNIPGLSQLERKVGVEETMRRYLLYFIMPLWMVTGLSKPAGDECNLLCNRTPLPPCG